MSDATREAMLELVPGYALGALTPEETRAFEAALAGSAELQRELRAQRELHAQLALADARTPPVELEARLRERIAGGKGAELPVGTAGLEAVEPVRRSFTPFAMGAALAATLILAVGLSLKVRSLGNEVRVRDSTLLAVGERLSQREATLNAILEPTVQLITMVAPGQTPPTIQVFFDPAKRSVILHTFQLSPAPDGRAYQLWFLRKSGTPIPSKVFNTEPTGHQLVQAIQVPAGEAISGFALTQEPAGGSPQPTTAPFVVGTLAGTQ